MGMMGQTLQDRMQPELYSRLQAKFPNLDQLLLSFQRSPGPRGIPQRAQQMVAQYGNPGGPGSTMMQQLLQRRTSQG